MLILNEVIDLITAVPFGIFLSRNLVFYQRPAYTFSGWMMSRAASPMILMADHFKSSFPCLVEKKKPGSGILLNVVYT